MPHNQSDQCFSERIHWGSLWIRWPIKGLLILLIIFGIPGLGGKYFRGAVPVVTHSWEVNAHRPIGVTTVAPTPPSGTSGVAPQPATVTSGGPLTREQIEAIREMDQSRSDRDMGNVKFLIVIAITTMLMIIGIVAYNRWRLREWRKLRGGGATTSRRPRPTPRPPTPV